MASGPQTLPNAIDVTGAAASAAAAAQEEAQESLRESTASIKSEDSDTVLVNKVSQDQQDAGDAERRPTLSRSSTASIKKCWICIGDTTEDDANNPPVWRSPCTCNLTAHEDCLLDWVAELENPKGKRRQSSTIRCPQCRCEIKIARPRSIIVELTKSVDRMLSNLVLPGLGAAMVGTIFAGSWYHGVWSVHKVFGPEQAFDIYREAMRHSGWIPAYALIPWNLIAARTNYSDFILPSGTLFLLSTQLSDGLRVDMTLWPPLPSTVFVCLPAVRTLYEYCYKRAFGDWNKRWLEEMQPRQVVEAANEERNAADVANREADEVEGGIVLELNIAGGALDEAEGQGNAAEEEGGQNQNQEHPAGNNGNNENRRILGERGEEIIDIGAGAGSTVLGALVFPAVAAGMGELLSYIIPSWWMSNANVVRGRPGLMRYRWGRSVVGGCLFVVLKDALVLYCRWKLAQSHRNRKIMDYDKKTKKYSV
ncbi:hypothetical protein DV735_g310, partial [Chaetothyriales sp. CBS 134920]